MHIAELILTPYRARIWVQRCPKHATMCAHESGQRQRDEHMAKMDQFVGLSLKWQTKSQCHSKWSHLLVSFSMARMDQFLGLFLEWQQSHIDSTQYKCKYKHKYKHKYKYKYKYKYRYRFKYEHKYNYKTSTKYKYKCKYTA